MQEKVIFLAPHRTASLSNDLIVFKEWIPKSFSLTTLIMPLSFIVFTQLKMDTFEFVVFIITAFIPISLFGFKHYIIIDKANNCVSSYWKIYSLKFRLKIYKFHPSAFFGLTEFQYDESSQKGILIELVIFNRVIRIVDTGDYNAVTELILYWKENNFNISVKQGDLRSKLKI